LELRHLRYFIAVAEELHFGRAAKRLLIAQPPLSLQIKRLEQEIGVRLFDRTRRQVRLTDAGRAFLLDARRAVADVERSVQVARQASRGETGRLALGFVQAAIYSVLPEILRTFRARYPGVALTLHELTTEEQLLDLSNGRIDLGLIRGSIHTGGLYHRVVLREPLILALPDTHALAKEGGIVLSALADAPFLMSTRHHGPALYDQIIGLCQGAGFTPHIVQEADRMQTIVGLVAAGIGVALVPESMSNLQRTGVAYRPIRGFTPMVEIVAAWRPDDPSPCLQSLLSVIQDAVTPDATLPNFRGA
jgi:DNA-binding transcriptional LysR family regulator